MDFVNHVCTTGHPMLGWANPKSVYFCPAQRLDLNKKFPRHISIDIDATIAHELRHVFQYQWAKLRSSQPIRSRFGPKWLIEGDAQLFEMRYIKHEHAWSANIGDWAFQKAQQYVKKSDLLKYHGSSLKRLNSETYKIGRLASWMLVEAHGEVKIREYFVALRNGDGPRKTFYDSFGMTISEFSETIREVGNSKKEIDRWIRSR